MVKKNKKIQKNDPIAEGWCYGMVVPDNWGNNISKKLKGRSHIELFGEKKAKELSNAKRERGKKLKGISWDRNKLCK